MKITWRQETGSSENVKVARASIGLHYALFSLSGELIKVGEGTSCAPTGAELDQIIAESGAAIDALVATQTPAPRSTMSAYRNRRTHFDNRIDMRAGSDLTRAMDFEDSAF